jgi:hypothetical protein
MAVVLFFYNSWPLKNNKTSILLIPNNSNWLILMASKTTHLIKLTILPLLYQFTDSVRLLRWLAYGILYASPRERWQFKVVSTWTFIYTTKRYCAVIVSTIMHTILHTKPRSIRNLQYPNSELHQLYNNLLHTEKHGVTKQWRVIYLS